MYCTVKCIIKCMVSSGRRCTSTHTKLASTPRYAPRYTTYSVDTDVHQPSSLCRDLGVNLGLSLGGPCLGHKFSETVIAHPRSRVQGHHGSDSEGQTHTDHMYRLPPAVTFYRSRVSQTCSDSVSETVHGTCCVWEVGTGNWFRSLQLINLSARWASCGGDRLPAPSCRMSSSRCCRFRTLIPLYVKCSAT